jgi:hypothetical protein
MSERLQHSNPWAEKLSQVSLPEWEGCWAAMEATLDREMPKGWWKDGRRWLLLILVLLLLIGVCRCPGRRWLAAGTSAGAPGTETGRTAGTAEKSGTAENSGTAEKSGTAKNLDKPDNSGTPSGAVPTAGAVSAVGKAGSGEAGDAWG